MHVRFPVFALAILALTACSTEPKPARYRPPGETGFSLRSLNPFAKKAPAPAPGPGFTPAPKRGLFSRILNPFGGDDTSRPRQSGIQVTVEPAGASPSLRATAQLGLRVVVTNYTSTLASLAFPTSQRIEIIGRTLDGKIFHTYSKDRDFTQESSILTINPGEYLEYAHTIPTRSMTAGNTYLITASVVGQVGLEATTSITPVP